MSGVKIQLSQKEMETAADAGIILTKNRVMQAVMEMLGESATQAVRLSEALRAELPEDFFRVPPKISRGENYRELPWMMLDFPRRFEKDSTLAIRQMFWWGRHFSVSLQVSGPYRSQVLAAWHRLPAGSLVCIHDTPWEHYLGGDNLVPLQSLADFSPARQMAERDFLKLSLVLPVTQWEEAPAFLLRAFNSWLELLRP